MDSEGAKILAKRLENVNPVHLATYGLAYAQLLELQKRLRQERETDGTSR